MDSSTTVLADKESILYALYEMGADAKFIKDEFSTISRILRKKVEVLTDFKIGCLH